MVTAQSLSISGKVIDKNSQEPVIGASVLIEGTSNGTITDLDGNFMLSNVPSKGNLVVSYIGYATQTLPINGRTSFSVVLAEDTETLDEVVVIGYGVQKKVNLTGSVVFCERRCIGTSSGSWMPHRVCKGWFRGCW